MADPSDGFYLDVDAWDGSKAVQRMSFTEEGVYFAMLRYLWGKRFLQDDPVAVAELIAISAGKHAEVLAAWPVVRRCFVLADRGPARIYNVRLEKTRRRQQQNWRQRVERAREAGKASARKRKQRHDLPVNGRSTDVEHESTIREEKRRDEMKGEEKKRSDTRLDPFTDPVITDRAGRFVERYERLYQKHRAGALYAVKPHRDYAAAVTLCQTWTDDARLDKLAAVFLTTNHKFAEEGSRTVPQFLALASWCDGKLVEWEAKQPSA